MMMMGDEVPKEIPCPAFFMRHNFGPGEVPPRFLNIAPDRETRESSLGIRNPDRESDCLIQTLPHHTCWETLGKIVELPMAVSLSLTGDVTNHPTSHSY